MWKDVSITRIKIEYECSIFFCSNIDKILTYMRTTLQSKLYPEIFCLMVLISLHTHCENWSLVELCNSMKLSNFVIYGFPQSSPFHPKRDLTLFQECSWKERKYFYQIISIYTIICVPICWMINIVTDISRNRRLSARISYQKSQKPLPNSMKCLLKCKRLRKSMKKV